MEKKKNRKESHALTCCEQLQMRRRRGEVRSGRIRSYAESLGRVHQLRTQLHALAGGVADAPTDSLLLRLLLLLLLLMLLLMLPLSPTSEGQESRGGGWGATGAPPRDSVTEVGWKACWALGVWKSAAVRKAPLPLALPLPWLPEEWMSRACVGAPWPKPV